MAIQSMTLYKRSKSGKIQQWIIEQHPTDPAFRTIEGFVDMIQSPSEYTYCEGKYIGKKNEVKPLDQTIKEMNSRIDKKLKSGYFADIADVDNERFQKPMLAEKFIEIWDEVREGWSVVATQPKLDGIRSLSYLATKQQLSREGNAQLSVPHIMDQLLIMFEGGEDKIKRVDGELYNHDLKSDFEKIVSLVRKQVDITDEVLQQTKELMEYHIYDIDVPGLHFAGRAAMLKTLFMLYGDQCPNLVLVDTKFHKVEQDIDTIIDQQFREYQSQGYEGAMIRNAESTYQIDRTKDLLKLKDFIDEEFKIVDIEEGRGNRSGMLGKVIFDGFKAGCRGNKAKFVEMLQNKDKYIGKMATVRYQNKTSKGSYRFPVVIAIRDYE